AGPKHRRRVRAAAAALARFQHPNIVQIYDVGEAAGRPYFVFEFVPGGSLAQHLHGTPQPVRPAAQLIETLARAVHAAHASGVIHRDLKPANIMLQRSEVRSQKSEDPGAHVVSSDRCPLTSDFCLLTSDFSPKITDFGLAKHAGDGGEAPDLRGHTLTGEIVGTPN